MKRLGRLAVGLAGVSVVAGVAWVAGSRTRSADQAVADAEAPAPAVLTEPVERRQLVGRVVLRGTVAPAFELRFTATAPDGADPVVTRRPVAIGDPVAAGDVVLEVAGRPVVVLPGAIPAYRDLKPGDQGPDVVQLEAALAGTGRDPGPADGVYDSDTESAVAELWRSLGYEPVEFTPAGLSIAEATDAVRQARATLAAAPPEERQAAQAALDRAEEALADLEAASGPMVPKREVLFAPVLPCRLAAVDGTTDLPSTDEAPVGPGVVLNGGQLHVDGRLRPADAPLVRRGTGVAIDAELTGDHAEGHVSRVGTITQDEATGETYVPLTVAVDEPLDPGLVGTDVRLSLTTTRTEGEVLVVPLASVSSRADGTTEVVVIEPGGARRRVTVRAGVSADGFVEVEPVGDGRLEAGDEVVVGR